MQIRIHKHQFFQVLLDHELMDTLATTLQRLLVDRNEPYVMKALDIVAEFAQGASSVKQDVCKSSILSVCHFFSPLPLSLLTSIFLLLPFLRSF
jgi:hypothetical protein